MDLTNPRTALSLATSILCILGLGYVGWAFVGSLKPTEATLRSHRLEIGLNGLAPGDILRVDWEGTDVYILRRTPTQIAWLQTYSPPILSDFAKLEEPSPMLRNPFRSFNTEYLVVGVWKNGSKWSLRENKRFSYLCDEFRYSKEPLHVSKATTFPGGFYCARWGSREVSDLSEEAWVYDPAGRSKSMWISPLSIPPHKFEGNTVVLGYDG